VSSGKLWQSQMRALNSSELRRTKVYIRSVRWSKTWLRWQKERKISFTVKLLLLIKRLASFYALNQI